MNADKLPTNTDILPTEEKVSDAAQAADLLDEIIGARGVREPIKSMLERAYSSLSRKNTAWTRRRVRAVFHKEASRIEHREIVEMQAIIEARKEHAAYREETARIASMALIRAPQETGGMAAG